MVGPLLSLSTASKWLHHLSDVLAPRAAHPLPQAACPDDSLVEKGGRGGEEQPVRWWILLRHLLIINSVQMERLSVYHFYRWGSWGSEREPNLWTGRGAKIESQALTVTQPCSLHTPLCLSKCWEDSSPVLLKSYFILFFRDKHFKSPLNLQ